VQRTRSGSFARLCGPLNRDVEAVGQA